MHWTGTCWHTELLQEEIKEESYLTLFSKLMSRAQTELTEQTMKKREKKVVTCTRSPPRVTTWSRKQPANKTAQGRRIRHTERTQNNRGQHNERQSTTNDRKTNDKTKTTTRDTRHDTAPHTKETQRHTHHTPRTCTRIRTRTRTCTCACTCECIWMCVSFLTTKRSLEQVRHMMRTVPGLWPSTVVECSPS